MVFGLVVILCRQPGLDTSARHQLGTQSLPRSMLACSVGQAEGCGSVSCLCMKAAWRVAIDGPDLDDYPMMFVFIQWW